MWLHDRALCFTVLSFQIGNFHLLNEDSGEAHPSSPDLAVYNLQIQFILFMQL